EHLPTVGPGDPELVESALAQARDEQLPHAAGTQGPHRPGATVPAVGAADQVQAARVGGPYCERGAADALVVDDPGAQPAPELAMIALGDEVEVELPEGGQEAVGIVGLPRGRGGAEPQPVACERPGDGRLEQSLGLDPG